VSRRRKTRRALSTNASIPMRGVIGAAGGIAGMLILYGIGADAAVAAVPPYEGVGLPWCR
jgi:hypothetical protein